MKKLLACFVAGVVMCGVAYADILIWQEDYSDVSDWIISYQPAEGVGATINSDGTYGLFYMESNSAIAAFSPTSYMAFDETTWDTLYSLSFDMESLSGSMSYSIGFDEFDADTNYLASVAIHPQGTFVGTTNYSLSGVSWNAGTELVRPKLTMSTGLGAQTTTIDEMQITSAIPEPGSAVLISMGLVIGWAIRRRRTRS